MTRGSVKEYVEAVRRRPRRYDSAVASALKMAWEAIDRLCSKRSHPFLPELVELLLYEDLFLGNEKNCLAPVYELLLIVPDYFSRIPLVEVSGCPPGL